MGLSVRGLDDELPPLRVQADRLLSDLSDQEDGGFGGFSQSQPQLVFVHRLFQGLSDLALGSEKPVRRDHSAYPLVGTGVVVMGDEVGEPGVRVVQLLGIHPVPEFVSDRLPESLGLP